jgi:hypothetical protein
MLLGCLGRDDDRDRRSFMDVVRERFGGRRRMPPVPKTNIGQRLSALGSSGIWGRNDGSSWQARGAKEAEGSEHEMGYSDDDTRAVDADDETCADEDNLEFKHYVFGAPREYSDSPKSVTSMSSASPRNVIKRD